MVVPIGRTELIAEARQALARRGGRVVLVGAPGIGKSTLVEHLLGSTEPANPIRLRASEVEQEVALTVLTDLVSAMAEPLAAAAESVRLCLSPLLRPGEVLPPWVDARALGLALAELLAGAAATGPMTLALDDLHWVDAPSHVVLTFALRRLGDADVRVLAGTRPGHGRELPDALALEVGALDSHSVRALIRSRTGRLLDADVASALHAAVDGNPMHALEVVRALPDEATSDQVRMPPSLVELVATRLDPLSDSTRQALVDVAVQGDADWDGLAHPEHLDEALAVGVVALERGRVGFPHPLLLRGVLDAADPGALRRAHSAAAGRTADPVLRGLHQLHAGVRADADAAAGFEHAARVAWSRGDLVAARDLAAGAVRSSMPASLDRWRRLHLQAQAQLLLGSFPDDLARQMRSEARSPDERAEVLLLSARSAESLDQALDLARTAAAIPGLSPVVQLDAATLAAERMLFLGFPFPALVAAYEAAIQDFESAVGADARSSTEWAQALASAAICRRLGGDPSAGDRLLEVPTDQDPRLVLGYGPQTVAAMIAIWDDRHEDARKLLGRCAVIEGANGVELASNAAYHLIELDSRVGNLGRVRAAAQSALEIESSGALLHALALVSAWRGERDRCLAEVARGEEWSAAVGDTLWPPALRTYRALLHLGLGDYPAALGDAGQVCAEFHSRGWIEPSVMPALPIAIEAAAATGDVDLARTLLDRLESAASDLTSRWAAASAARGRAHIALAEGEPESALASALRSADAFGQLGLPLEEGRSALTAGRAARRAGHRRQARDLLTRATALFEPERVAGFAAQAEDELARIGGRTAHGDALTESERRIAARAARGGSNAEIAAAEYLSIKTVESHLTRIYRKLGVRSRAELAALAARADGEHLLS